MCWAVGWIFEAEDVEQWEERFAISGCLSGLKGGALVIVGGVPSSTVQDGINLTLAGLPCPALPYLFLDQDCGRWCWLGGWSLR